MPSGKKLINTVERCVDENLEGLVMVNPGLRLVKGHRVIVRADIEEYKAAGKVGLISGGGSGHEPGHAGYVGPGMLTASIAGSVFTSPPPGDILAAIRAAGKGNPAGVLLIVKSYTGDRLNFGIAAEKAMNEGIPVSIVVIGEDCALMSDDKTAGRRGLCGTLFIHKIAGALAEEGKSLEEILARTQSAANCMGTLGVCLSPCSVPGSDATFQIGLDEMEVGLGLHGEAGVKRMKLMSAKDTIKVMIDHMTNTKSSTHINIKKGDRIALMVNNLGATTVLEMNILVREAILFLESKGVVVERAYCGSFITSLEMSGISLSVLHLDDTRRRCLDASTEAPGWQKPYLPQGVSERTTPLAIDLGEEPEVHVDNANLRGMGVTPENSQLLYNVLSHVCQELVSSENHLNVLDSKCGDGDCGTTLRRGSEAILKRLGLPESPSLPVHYPHSMLLAVAQIVEEEMGGSSGALYSLFFTAAAKPLTTHVTSQAWVDALQAGNDAITRYGRAEPGDRSMLDPLHTALQVLKENIANPREAIQKAADAAQAMALHTAEMKPVVGRSSYGRKENWNQPDPGAVAVGIWMNAISSAVNK
ncbi:unnamed protein product [Owenia fusiformis]|uniref:Triokinase/FMN cyclase n=1 Tax=Owenia fusiformis TaxID=6347 RepID=A0A8S4PFK7_OWEFU|nr:unnamed protein product [Owenia fusiformis]